MSDKVQKQIDPTELYYEDFKVNATYHFTIPGVSTESIKDFASRYDPQRFHLDEKMAQQTHFGGLVASGFQTQLLCFKPFCDEVLQKSSAVGSPGIDRLQWKKPWFANQKLDVLVSLKEKRLSSKRTDRGYVTFTMIATASGSEVLVMDWVVIFLLRNGG